MACSTRKLHLTLANNYPQTALTHASNLGATPTMPSEVDIQSTRDELKNNVLYGIDGFFAKYFEGKSWSATIENKTRDAESAEIVSKLRADVSSLANSSALAQWLATFQSLFFGPEQAGFHFRTQLASERDSPFIKTNIYLETSNVDVVAVSTRVFGEFHHGGVPSTIDDDSDFLRFCALARQVFKNQSARCFLHAFLVRDMALELWVFDRSGAFSSKKLDLKQSPDLLVHILAGYTMMSDEEAGINTFVKRLEPGPHHYVTFDQADNLYLRFEMIATTGNFVGPCTTCYAASVATTGEPDTIVKFSWREDEVPTEFVLLKKARERKVWGTVQLVGHQDLTSIFDLRQGLHFPQPVVNRVFSCVATAPLGRPIQKFTSIPELLEVLCHLVKALRSLYLNGRMLHRDISIKNLVIAPQRGADDPKGLLIDFDLAVDLDNVRDVEPTVGSDGFMAIGILSGQPHTYRHDLESLFYVFLWLAIGNDHEHDNVHDILKNLPETSRLWTWCTMDFASVRQAKLVDMSPEGFSGILDEFSAEFTPLRDLAMELFVLIFPIRNGKVFTGTEMEQGAVERLYDRMADALKQKAIALSSC